MNISYELKRTTSSLFSWSEKQRFNGLMFNNRMLIGASNRMTKKMLTLGISLFLLIIAFAGCMEEVENNGGGEVTFSIQQLIDNALPGDMITIPSDTYYENIVINKSISLIGENEETTIIVGNGIEDVIYISADGINLSGFTIQNSGQKMMNGGIYIRSNYNTIFDNIIENNKNCGIFLWFSSNNNIFENTITNNSDYGIYIHGSFHNNIHKNTILKNRFSGVYLGNSSHNKISENIITNNSWDGVSLYASSIYNIILDNNIANNDKVGIRISQSSNNNTISGNNLTKNLHYGILLFYSSNEQLYIRWKLLG